MVHFKVGCKNESVIITDEEALKIGSELFDYAERENMHMVYEFVSDKEVELSDDLVGLEIKNFSEVENHFTTDCKTRLHNTDKEDNCLDVDDDDNTIIKYNNSYYEVSVKRGDASFADTSSLEIVDKREKQITFKVSYFYCEDNFYNDDQKECEDGSKMIKEDYDFIIRKENDEWKIDYYVMPY